MNVRSFIPVGALGLLLWGAPPVAAQTTVHFEDAEFAPAAWTMGTAWSGPAGTVTETQELAGGFPDAYRRVHHQVGLQVDSGYAWSFHFLTAANHTPGAQGAVLGIDFSESSARFSSLGHTCGLAIRQGGLVYLGPALPSLPAINTWQSRSQTGLTAGNFGLYTNPAAHPNFSSGGGPMLLGFYRHGPLGQASGIPSTASGIDNWSVTLHVAGATPSAVSTWGRVKALYR